MIFPLNSFPPLALLALLVVSDRPAQATLNVVATTPDLGAIALEVGGDRIDLTTLAKSTEDPHFVDAKPSFIVRLNRANVLIDGGADLEIGWLAPLLQGARNSRIAAGQPGRIMASAGVPLLDIPTVLDRSQGDIHAAGNPHFLADPVNAKIVATHLAQAFTSLEPSSANVFTTNLQRFNGRVDAKLAEWQALLAPYQGQPLVTYHNYWIYFGRRFGFPMTLFLEPKPGIPPTPAHLAEVIGKMKAQNAKLILVQPYQSRRTAETVARHADGVVLDFPSFPGEPGPEGYLEWVDLLVYTVAQGFSRGH